MLPAIQESRNGTLVAIASREQSRAQTLATEFGITRIHGGYEDVLADSHVDAVYVPLVNSLHREWTARALAAGKHVLCEKPLALNAAEAEAMRAAATDAGRVLMEALMYRFHPRINQLRAEAVDVVHLSARFGFPLDAPGNYRLDRALGGGALLDVGTYCVSSARWFCGEPSRVEAVAHVAGGVDLSVAAVLEFRNGATASIWGSFESPEEQELVLVERGGVRRLQVPFTSWKDPDDPYRLMVEEFADAALQGRPAPLPLEDSIGTLRVLDAIRSSFEAGSAVVRDLDDRQP